MVIIYRQAKDKGFPYVNLGNGLFYNLFYYEDKLIEQVRKWR